MTSAAEDPTPLARIKVKLPQMLDLQWNPSTMAALAVFINPADESTTERARVRVRENK